MLGRLLKIVGALVVVGAWNIFGFPSVAAQEKSMPLKFVVEYEGEVREGQTLKVLIGVKNTSSEPVELDSARLSLTISPETAKMLKVTANTEFFCDYPTDPPNYVSNVEKGILIITGKATGTKDCPYPNLKPGEVKHMVEIILRVKKAPITLHFLYDGSAEAGDVSYAMLKGSPPVFALAPPEDFVIAAKSTPTVTEVSSPPTPKVGKQVYKVPTTVSRKELLASLALGFTLIFIGIKMVKRRSKVDVVIHVSD